MWKPALVGAVVLATATTSVSFLTTAVQAQETRYAQRQSPRAQGFMTEAQIKRFKMALRLNAEQKRYWPAVASVLRTMRLGNRAMAVANNALSLRRLVSAATPLFRSLDDGQKQTALRLVRSLGFGPFVAAL